MKPGGPTRPGAAAGPAGGDSSSMAHLVDPPLSTVSQPALEMGARSADLLLRLIGGKAPRPKTLIMMPKLVLRGTTRQPMESES